MVFPLKHLSHYLTSRFLRLTITGDGSVLFPHLQQRLEQLQLWTCAKHNRHNLYTQTSHPFGAEKAAPKGCEVCVLDYWCNAVPETPPCGRVETRGCMTDRFYATFLVVLIRILPAAYTVSARHSNRRCVHEGEY